MRISYVFVAKPEACSGVYVFESIASRNEFLLFAKNKQWKATYISHNEKLKLESKYPVYEGEEYASKISHH